MTGDWQEQHAAAAEVKRRAECYDDLLEALQAVFADCQNIETESHLSPEVGRMVHAAIKATGETT